MDQTTRRRFIASGAAVGTVAVAGCSGQGSDEEEPTATDEQTPTETDEETPTETEEEEEPYEAGYEIWAADQGTDTVYVYEPADEVGEEFELIDEIDTGAEDGFVPHMVDYSSDFAYAAIACTSGERTLIYRTEDRELVANLETGAGSHFAGFSPDDEYVHVDVIGESEVVRIDADLDAEEFEIVDRIAVDDSIEGLTEQEGAPICHSYDKRGRSFHTLGPSYNNAGLLVIDHDEFAVERAFSGEEVPTNCGTMPHPTEEKFYFTAGLPTPTDDDGEPLEGEEGVGDYYVMDTAADELLVDGASTGGVDAHGFWFTPDGEELWVLNRETNNGVVLDPETDEVIDEIDAYGPAVSENSNERDSPDILWGSPDGEFMFVTLRGPSPQSGDPHAATGVNPGFAVLDVETREIVTTVEPDADNDESDFHGIGVRPTGEYDGYLLPPF